MNILLVGDIHGRFSEFIEELNELNPNIVLSTGDFGYWPDKYDVRKIWGSNRIPIYFCDGNHEDHSVLKEYSVMTEVADNVFYMPRGSTLELPDGQTILFVGGARSIDRDYRIENFDYFPEEELKSDFFSVLDNVEKTDIVISHTKPTGIDIGIDCDNDPSMEILDEVFEMYYPSKWYFSHFHIYSKQYSDGCEWTCLNQFNEPGWYEWLEIDN